MEQICFSQFMKLTSLAVGRAVLGFGGSRGTSWKSWVIRRGAVLKGGGGTVSVVGQRGGGLGLVP